MTIPVQCLLYVGILGYTLIGLLVGRRIYRIAWQPFDPFAAYVAAFGAWILWPVVLLGWLLADGNKK